MILVQTKMCYNIGTTGRQNIFRRSQQSNLSDTQRKKDEHMITRSHKKYDFARVFHSIVKLIWIHVDLTPTPLDAIYKLKQTSIK